jgi:hypothetical protein
VHLLSSTLAGLLLYLASGPLWSDRFSLFGSSAFHSWTDSSYGYNINQGSAIFFVIAFSISARSSFLPPSVPVGCDPSRYYIRSLMKSRPSLKSSTSSKPFAPADGSSSAPLSSERFVRSLLSTPNYALLPLTPLAHSFLTLCCGHHQLRPSDTAVVSGALTRPSGFPD